MLFNIFFGVSPYVSRDGKGINMKNNNDLGPANRKQELLEQLAQIEVIPVDNEQKIGDIKYKKISFDDFLAKGTAAFSIVDALMKASLENNKGGLCWVTIPKEMHLAAAKDGLGYRGTALSDETNKIAGQARIHNVPLNPTQAFMATTVYAIDVKLDEIQETQKDIQTFLEQKERSDLKGSLNFLTDVLNNYKYNWNNDLYLKNNHLKVLDIKEQSEKKIYFYRNQILEKINKQSFLHMDNLVNKQIEAVKNDFSDYHLSLYLLAFSSFLDVVLSESFDTEYIESISKKLNQYSIKYRELYTDCFNQIEKYSKTSIQSSVLKGISAATKVVGKTIEKTPVISKSPIDEALIGASKKIHSVNENKTMKLMDILISCQSGYIKPFMDSLETVKNIYSNDLNLLFDSENIYINQALIN